MDNTQLQYIKIQSQYIDKLEQFEKCIIKAAKAAHSLADTAEKKCGQAWAALESGNMDVMRNTIQQYISRYGQDWARTAYRWIYLCTTLRCRPCSTAALHYCTGI